MSAHLTLLNPDKPHESFPSLNSALTVPDGLLAVGGCLSKARLLNAYRRGIFPWYSPNEPILWWSPNPRLVLFPEKLKISRSLNKAIKKQRFKITVDQAFEQVIMACAGPRKNEKETWISPDICQAYQELYRSGYAHSCEAWLDGQLAGGLYGVAIGRVFFGESMFHRHTDASKIAFVEMVTRLTEWQYRIIDCQVSTHHLKNFGAEDIIREDFTVLLDRFCPEPPASSAWQV